MRVIGVMPNTSAARTMCSTSSRLIGPCSQSIMTKSYPIAPNSSTRSGAWRLMMAPNTTLPSASFAFVVLVRMALLVRYVLGSDRRVDQDRSASVALRVTGIAAERHRAPSVAHLEVEGLAVPVHGEAAFPPAVEHVPRAAIGAVRRDAPPADVNVVSGCAVQPAAR